MLKGFTPVKLEMKESTDIMCRLNKIALITFRNDTTNQECVLGVTNSNSGFTIQVIADRKYTEDLSQSLHSEDWTLRDSFVGIKNTNLDIEVELYGNQLFIDVNDKDIVKYKDCGGHGAFEFYYDDGKKLEFILSERGRAYIDIERVEGLKQ